MVLKETGKATGIYSLGGDGVYLAPTAPKITKSYVMDITLPRTVPWWWRLWRVLCLPYDIAVFIKTGRLRFL